MYSQNDKVCGLNELVRHIDPGDTVALGGGLSCREPMAAIRAMIRTGIDRLTLVGSAHGIDVDLLCAADAVAVSAESYVGFEQDFGMAPNFRRACETGAINIEDNCCYTLVQQLRAGIAGLPFMSIRSVRGSDFMTLHPEFKTMTCPFTGAELVLVPALTPDVAVLHAHAGDRHGNLHISGPPVADILFAKASKKVIATVETVVEPESLTELGVTIPYFYVTAISEVAYGAHPTSCYPNYAYDRKHTAFYYQNAKLAPEVFKENYLQPFVLEPDNHSAYLTLIGGIEQLTRLQQWSAGDRQWMSLYE